MELLSNPAFWLALGSIVWINIILSGDNAVVIALAARSLPEKQQKQAVMWGAGAAVILRILLTFVAAKLLEFPWLQIVGGLLLLWIGVQLMAEEDEESHGENKNALSFGAAVRTILIADLVMSLDNVIGVALAAKIDGVLNYPLLVIGLVISIPLVVFGSTFMIKLMEKFPIIITLGAALIGWVAGDAITHDPVFKGNFGSELILVYGIKAACAIFVVGTGTWLAKRSKSKTS